MFAVQIGGASSSGLPRDSAGNEIAEGPDDQQAQGNSVWDKAPTRRLRMRKKGHEQIQHEHVLGPEPQLNAEDADAARDDEPDRDGADEAFPELNCRVPMKKPGKVEVQHHEITHLPFRQWCDACVAGRGVARPHRRSDPVDADESLVSRVVFDWAFMKDREGGQLINVLIGIDHRTSCKVSMVTDNRLGNNEETILSVLNCLKLLGHHGQVEIRTDGEPALVELMRKVAERRSAPTFLRRTPPYDSQSNGRVERTVRSLEEITRVLKIDLEKRINERISVESVIFQWLLRHGTMLLNIRQPGADGRTSYERMYGRPYRGELLRFGSPVQLKLDNAPDGGLMQTRWTRGLWLGKSHGNDEHLIWGLDGTGIRRARSVMPRDGPVTADQLRGVLVRPGGRPNGQRSVQDRGGEVAVRNRDDVRQWQITRAAFNEFGATPGCGRCADWSRNIRSQRGHTQVCRDRFKHVLRHHPVFGPRIVESAIRTGARSAEPEPAEAAPAGPRGEPNGEQDVDMPAGANEDAMDEGEAADDEAGDELMQAVADPNAEVEPDYVQDWWTDELEAKKMDGVTPAMIAAAKAKELSQLHARSTFELRQRRDLPHDLQVVGTRWVLVNKGSSSQPVVKARLVCQEFNTYKDMDLFSGTPGLLAVKLLIADLARNRGDRCAMLLDVTGAFLYGQMRRQVGIRLPPELGTGPGVIGLLHKSLYGLRDAPLIWQQHIANVLGRAGFEESPTTVGLFRHGSRHVLIAAHVDDILATGTVEDLEWLRATLAAEYDLKSTLLGPSFEREASFLKRRLQWCADGLRWTADPKHAEHLVREWASPTWKRALLAVGPEANKPPHGDPLEPAVAKSFRSAAARFQYLSHDRPDLSLVSTVLASRMSKPVASDLEILRRAADYLRSHPSVSLCFPWTTGPVGSLTVCTDSDWASCEVTRRSKSGGVIQWAGYTVMHFCRLQDSIALSSAEAELKSTCKGVAEALGLTELATFLFKTPVHMVHRTDASACVGILKRRGAGPVKHLSVRQLWVQEVFTRPNNHTQKIPRAENPADLLCSLPTAESLRVHFETMGFEHNPAPTTHPRGGSADMMRMDGELCC